jgi:FMN-dependent NADH-azoreductase
MSMNLLHLDSSITGPHSVSRALSVAAVDRLRATLPHLHVIHRDLAATPIPHLSGAYLAGLSGAAAEHDAGTQRDLALGGEILDEFIAADIVVIGVALYNFSIPSQLKAWIDRVTVAGKTFRYTDKGVEGLAGDKRVILTIARGGHYGPGAPAQPLEHAETYLRGVLGFLGVTQPEVIVSEGVALGPDQREASLKAALAQVASLKAA